MSGQTIKSFLPTNIYEPKRANRWLVNFPEDINITPWSVAKTMRPSLSFKNGKSIVNPITMILRDPISPSTSQAVISLMNLMTPRKLTFFEKIKSLLKIETYADWGHSFKEYEKFKDGFDYVLDLLDPCGIVVEKWVLCGCKIIDVNFGELNYADDGLAHIKIVLQPKHFIMVF